MFFTTRQSRGAATVTAAVTAAALAAGLTSTHAFAATGGSGKSGEGTTAGSPGAAGMRWVTLITGDRVGVDARGRVVAVEQGPGREKIPVRSWAQKGRTYVVPADAEKLIARGTLDRRLFDVTTLSTPESRRAYRKGLKVIVAYGGASGPAARKGVRADAAVQRSLPSLNADAVTVPERDAGALWEALTRKADGTVAARTAPGIARVWLDGVRTASLDKSVAQIGAPKAWQSGYDGTGVTIAVLDSGVDETHADLKGQVKGEANFSDSPDTEDRNGHGTHVASTAAGTGAGEGGRFKGVAPGAKLLNGKVLDDYGNGSDSGVLAGIDWAVAQGADIINMSLGGADTPEVDLLEAHVNKVSKEKGVLFAIAAGNEGPLPGTISSPGSADAALTVGAVDDADKMADFSSVGPRIGDGGAKPDLTGPGVDITAASAPGSALAQRFGENPAGYLTISGTSMATPHAAGAAALLKQRNPGWTGERIKSVLTGSAKDGGHGVFQQGTGRLSVDRALEQTVVSDETSLSFGHQQWPHDDDTPVTQQITYRNLGSQDVELDLAVRGLDPKGQPAAAGFFTLGATRVTVPAGGTVSVPMTADTRIGGDNNGAYTATVTATGGGRTVRTTAAVDREVESYDLTLNYTGSDGKPSKDFISYAAQLAGVAEGHFFDNSGKPTVTYRLPKGDYVLNSMRLTQVGAATAQDRLVHPKLSLTKNTTVEVDARLAKPVRMSIPDTRATQTNARSSYTVDNGRQFINSTELVGSFDHYRVGQLGPKRPTGVVIDESFNAQWERGAIQYNGAAGGRVKQLSNGHTTKFKATDFAKITATTGASVKGKKALSTLVNGLDGWSSDSETPPYALPGSRTHYAATIGRTNRWSVEVEQLDAEGYGETWYASPERDYRPGTTHRITLGTAVHSPLMTPYSGVFRRDDALWAEVPLFSDSRGNAGVSAFTSAKTTLYRGTTKIGENADALQGEDGFHVGPEDAQYTLTTSVRRDPAVSSAGTRIDGSWTFRSAQTAPDELVRTPLSTVRFGAPVALDGTAPAGRKVTFPVTVQGPAAGKGLKGLAVSVSYDGGKTWQRVPVTKGSVTIKNPAKGKTLALRGQVADTKGGKASVTVYDAYRGK
ncbi:S8 family serine peptidase [Streptomyces sp. SID5473]|uniref:Peptidase S8 n=2 Tax=Streptomyces tsukubensis TaxID=83656 RepID=A0A7G3UD67_STRT9|nr:MULTISPECIES: S8 family serine peptidase [Streptomyces]AZK95621.1 peptidase S8 [Streptomyces tsukubensis]MYS68427.1 S8 family serine peptidase [Streptomyces sp. SID5473]QKM68344.1 peptidase S8 [Streptomyces tsukubensis NRRL18488]TAI43162.1 peptidase S8 [Streptomyces tsukubensis]